jgi:hypothetical protein
MISKELSEQDICSKYILSAITDSGWNLHTQIREQVTFTAGRIQIHGKTISRGEKKRADFILYYKNNLPIAVVEAKDNNHSSGAGLEQAKQYAGDFESKELGDIDTKKYMKFLLKEGNIYEQRHVLLNIKSRLLLRDGKILIDKTPSDVEPVSGAKLVDLQM